MLVVPYSYVWGRQTQGFIVAHGKLTEVVMTGSDDVILYEKASQAVVKWWIWR